VRRSAYLAVLTVIVGALLAWWPAATPPVQAAPNKPADLAQAGPYAVGHLSLMLFDASRPGDRPGEATYNGVSRPIPVSIWYPVDPATVAGRASDAIYPLDPLYGVAPDTYSPQWEAYGIDPAFEQAVPSAAKPFPLLVFSPGWGGPNWIHTSLGTRLASHGFVVAVPYHFGDQWWLWEPPYDPLAVASYNRPRDVTFVLDDLLARNQAAGDLLNGLIRPHQVAAGGWSLGGYAAMALAGGDDLVCDTLYGIPGLEDPPDWTCAPTDPDPRIKAITPVDGSNQVLHFAELARITVPALGIGEEWDAVLDWQARQHAAFSGHPAYRVDVAATNHQSFSDICEAAQLGVDSGIFPELGESMLAMFCTPDYTPSGVVHELTGKYVAAFLRTQLAGEPGYQAVLTPGWAIAREQLVEFFVTERRSPQSIDDDWPGLFVYFPHQPGSLQARGPKDPSEKRAVNRLSLVQ